MPRTKRKTREDQGIVYSCNAYLDQRWQEITRQFELAAPGEPEDPLGEDHALILSIRQSL